MNARLAAAAIYLGLMTFWIYGVANRWDPDSGAWLVPLLVFVQLASGFALGRWWAVLLPVLLPFISVPAGTPPITPDNAEPFPIWFGLVFLSPVAGVLIALGIATRTIIDRRSHSDAAIRAGR